MDLIAVESSLEFLFIKQYGKRMQNGGRGCYLSSKYWQYTVERLVLIKLDFDAYSYDAYSYLDE